ncbi:MAG TPA: sulfurtransferase TusA family protein, partial [Longimicrobiales bacterium]|nr:sulfurtransferase TusA family protein [Longimicrobiales bacterium]
GLERAEVVARLDYFAASPSPATREMAESLGAIAVVMRAVELRDALPEEAEAGRRRPRRADPIERIVEAGSITSDREYDAGALGCAEVAPVVRRALRELEVGQVLAVRSEAPEAGPTLVSWARMAGHAYLGSADAGRGRIHYIRRGK